MLVASLVTGMCTISLFRMGRLVYCFFDVQCMFHSSALIMIVVLILRVLRLRLIKACEHDRSYIGV